MTDIRAWPNPAGRPEAPPPRPIVRPCDYGLFLTVTDLETQLGTIEAYNRLATAAAALKAKIDAGNAKPQNPLFAVSVRGTPDRMTESKIARAGRMAMEQMYARRSIETQRSSNANGSDEKEPT